MIVTPDCDEWHILGRAQQQAAESAVGACNLLNSRKKGELFINLLVTILNLSVTYPRWICLCVRIRTDFNMVFYIILCT